MNPTVVTTGRGRIVNGVIVEAVQVRNELSTGPAFHRCRVSMPSEGMQLGHPVFFAIDVVLPGGPTCRVMRRYNQFHALQEDLARKVREDGVPGVGLDSIGGFPSRMFAIKSEARSLEPRRQALEKWLVDSLQALGDERHADTRAIWQELLRRFLTNCEPAARTSEQGWRPSGGGGGLRRGGMVGMGMG